MGVSFIGLGLIWLTLVNGIPIIQNGKNSRNGIPDADGICRESGFRRNVTDLTCMQFYR